MCINVPEKFENLRGNNFTAFAKLELRFLHTHTHTYARTHARTHAHTHTHTHTLATLHNFRKQRIQSNNMLKYKIKQYQPYF